MTRPHFEAEKDANAVQEIVNGDNRIIKPRELNIMWGNDERYWKIPEKGTNDAAELLQISWLEVTGSVRLTAGKSYSLTFNVELMPEAFGWERIQPFLMAKVGKKGRYKWKRVKLDHSIKKIPKDGDELTIQVPAQQNNNDTMLEFGLYEVWSGKWKGGLKIKNVEVKVVSSPLSTN